MRSGVVPAPERERFVPVRLHREARPRGRERLGHIAVCIIGLAAPFQLQFMGVLYAPEVVLALVASWALLTMAGNAAFWSRTFTTTLACLGVTMLAYIVADLSLGTEVTNLLRGWARIVFLGSNFVGFYFLCRRNPVNLVIYSVA